ncbi:MAG: hypothetical protein QME12_07700 [Nanoarchaeota archaeon]|nr:hypothetical protein [Nanoarchaeota archaeon]
MTYETRCLQCGKIWAKNHKCKKDELTEADYEEEQGAKAQWESEQTSFDCEGGEEP